LTSSGRILVYTKTFPIDTLYKLCYSNNQSPFATLPGFAKLDSIAQLINGNFLIKKNGEYFLYSPDLPETKNRSKSFSDFRKITNDSVLLFDKNRNSWF